MWSQFSFAAFEQEIKMLFYREFPNTNLIQFLKKHKHKLNHLVELNFK